MRKHILLGFLAMASSAAMAQVNFPQTNKASHGDAAYAWLPAGTGPTAGDANTRGMAYHAPSGRLLFADRDSSTGNLVQSINASTFANAGALAGGSILSTSSLFAVNKVRVGTDGAIYVGSLTTAAGSPWYIHRHADLVTTSAIATTVTANFRLGDDFVTTGGGNGLVGLATGSGNTSVWRFTSVDGGVTLTGQQLSVTSDTLAGFNYFSFDPDNSTTVWSRQGQASNTTTSPLKLFTLNTSTVDLVSTATSTIGGAGPHLMVRYNGTKYNLTAEIGASNAQVGQAGKLLVLVNATSGLVEFQGVGIERAGGLYANANGAGDVVWAPAVDRAFVYQTSNGVTAFNTGPIPASARDWNLY